MTQSPEEHPGLDAQIDRLLDPAVDPQEHSGDLPRLTALLAAAAAPSDAGPQPGETVVLDAFRELVTEAAGTPSLVRRHRRRAVVIASASTVAMLASGVAAAATGSLPGAAQQTAKTVLGTLGVHVPGPNAPGNHPNERGKSGDHRPAGTPFGPPTGLPSGPPTALPTPGNSGVSRHHGNPTPTSTAHPAPHHGKPAAPPAVVPSQHANPRVAHVHPNATPYRVMRGSNRPITH